MSGEEKVVFKKKSSCTFVRKRRVHENSSKSITKYKLTQSFHSQRL